MSVDYTELVDIPTNINPGLRRAQHSTMLRVLGRPGGLTENCSPITNRALKARLTTSSVGPFRVTGLDIAVTALRRVLARVQVQHPDLHAILGTEGMACCRKVRTRPGRPPSRNFSNHSWGTAIDLKVGGQLDPRGDGKCQRGLLVLAPYFNAEGFYWGAGYGGALEDAMHFELSEERVTSIR
jgi:hypothetical protein